MAISTNGTIITRLAGALYGEYLSNASYVEVSTTAPATVAANWLSNDFAGKTDAQIATTVLANLSLSTVAGLDNWVAAQLTAAGSTTAAKGAKLVSLLNDYSQMTADVTYGASATAFNGKVSASLTLSQTTGAAGGSFAAVSSASPALTLTSATQTSTGGAGDDTFTAGAGTWGAGDVVNGGLGSDTLNATVTGTAPTQSATSLVSVETLNLTASPNPATLDLTGVTGLTSVNNVSSANGASLSVSGLGNVVNTSITGGNTSTTVNYTTAVTAATALTDAATLTLNGTSATSSFSTAGVETLTVNSATAANTLASLTNTGMTKLNITGSQALTVTAAVGGTTIATVDASAATGAVTLATGNGAGGTALTGVTVTAPTAATAGLFTITTGTSKDTVNLGAGTSLVSTGAGADTINSGAGNTTIIPGAGNDIVNAGAGVETIRFDAAAASTNADTINNFGATDVLSINLGRAQVTGTSGAPATSVFGSLLTTNGVTATSPTFAGVSGTGAATAIVFQSAAAGTATANTIAQASNVIALTGVFTDGTAAGVITALGATGAAGVTTQLDSRFLLVTYSVGNIAQVWSYTGDNQTAAAGTSVLTDIDAAELSLVATLNNVTSGSLTAANFSTYLDAAAVTATTSSTGQTINIGLPLSQVTTTSNTLGQYFTAASDTVNVAVGMLPNALASSTAGLTLLDDTAGDGDVLNVTGLTAAALTTASMGTFTSNIETINMNLLIGGGNFAAASNTPGTTTFGFTGTGGQTITALPAAATIKFDAAASNAVAGTLSASGAFNVALNGSGVAPTTVTGAPTVPTLAMTSGTTSTTTVTGTSYLGAQAGSFFGAAASAATITGAGNLTISGTAATFDAQVGGVSTTGYTGSLTLRPTDAASFDLSGTGADTSKFTGVRTVDFSQTTGAGTVTLASDNGAWPVTVTSNASSFSANVTQAGSGLTDALVVTAALAAGNIGSISALGIETLTVNLGGTSGTTTSKTVGGITMSTNAATQAVTVNSNSSGNTLGTVTADSLNTSSIAGTVSATLANNGQGSAYTGPAAFASYITGTGMGDIITTGTANDAIWINATTNTSGSSNLNAGLGNDTYRFLHTSVNSSQITDAGGTDTLALTGATSDISGLNNGGSLVGAGIEQVVVTSGGVMSIATGQVTGAVAFNGVAGANLAITQTTVGTAAAPAITNISSATFSSINYLSNAGLTTAGTAVTGTVVLGGSGVDSITGSTLADAITGGGAADIMTGGALADTFIWASATAATAPANLATETGTAGGATATYALGSVGDTITGFVSGTDKLSFAAAILINDISTETNTMTSIAKGGTFVPTSRFHLINNTVAADNVDTYAGAVTILDGLTTTLLATAADDTNIFAMSNGTNMYLYYVQQLSTANTIAAQDVTFIGVLTGVTVLANGDFITF
jgi:hypothetical protein